MSNVRCPIVDTLDIGHRTFTLNIYIMEKFAFIIHPIDARKDVARKYPIAQYLPERLIEWYLKKRDPLIAAHITGVRSLTGAEAEGWFIACPLTPRQFLSLPIEFVWDKLEKCGHIAEDLGAKRSEEHT